MKDVLEEVNDLIRDRSADYGDAEDMHNRIADLWSSYLDQDLSASDVAVMMVLFKIARSTHGDNEKTLDDIKDMLGYAMFAAEFRLKEAEEDQELFDPRLIGFSREDIEKLGPFSSEAKRVFSEPKVGVFRLSEVKSANL